MKFEKKVIRFFCVISLFLALPILGNSVLAAEKAVTYMSLADYTGPIAGLCVYADMGAEDYCKYINDQGGIQGVKINFLGVDTRYDVARMVSAYKRYRRGSNVFLINSVSSGGAKALSPLIDRDKLVQYAPHDGELVARPTRSFTWGPTYQDMFCAMMDWIIKDWQSKGKSGAPKVGYMGWDNPYGKEPLRGGKEYAAKLKINLLQPEFFPTTALDTSIYLSRLDRAGANYIIVGGIDPNPTKVLRDAYKIGLTKKIQFICDWWGPNERVGIKAHPDATEGAVVIAFFLRGEDARNNSMAKLWTKYRKKPISEMPGDYLVGMTWVMTYAKALEKALQTVSYKKLTGDIIYKAFQQLDGIERAGIIGPCKFSKTSRRNTDVIRFYRIQNKKAVSISGWIKTPDGVAMHKW